MAASERECDEHDPAGQEGHRDERPAPIAAGQDAHRLGWLERGQHERATQTGGQPRRAGVVEAGHADHDRMLDRRDLLDQQADRRLGCGPGRHPIDEVGRGPDGFARDDHEPDVERGVVDGDRLEALADLEGHPLPAVLERHPRRRAGRCSRVRRKTSGRWASSSNSSSASIRPRTLT